MSVLEAPPTMNSGLDTSSYSGRDDQSMSKTVKDITENFNKIKVQILGLPNFAALIKAIR